MSFGCSSRDSHRADFAPGFANPAPRTYISWRGFCVRAPASCGAPEMSTLIVIPARLGATRLPQKPLRLLGGKPLIVRVWEHVSAMGLADQVVVATEATEVADAARAAGAAVAMTRSDHPSGTDRVAEVARQAALSGIRHRGERPGRRAVHRQRSRTRRDERFVAERGVSGRDRRGAGTGRASSRIPRS